MMFSGLGLNANARVEACLHTGPYHLINVYYSHKAVQCGRGPSSDLFISTATWCFRLPGKKNTMNTQKTIMFQSTIKNRNLPCFILQSSGSGAEASGEHQPVSVHLSHHQQPAGTLHYPRLRTRAPLPPKVSSTLRRDGDH